MMEASTKTPRKARELKDDKGGAIIVIGTFMAFFLTAGMFFIMGTGEAIIYRERVQDAADAIAFSSAGVHARGMNLIVLINMIMAAILAVLVALKMLVVMLGVATAIACVIAWFVPIAATVCSWGLNITPKINNAANQYQNTVVKNVLPVLSFTQRVVAWTTPYVALAKSTQWSKQYEPLVTGGIAISPSMVPCLPGGCQNGKIGLPVQEDSYANLCKKAGEYVAEIAFFWLPGIIKTGLQKFAGWVAGTFPGWFCGGGGVSGDGSGGIGEGLNIDLKKFAKEACEEEEKKKKQDYENANGDTDGFSFDMDKCKKDREEKMKKDVDQSLGENTAGGLQGGLQTDKMTPKKVYDGAKHGGFYFQVWGFANADTAWPRRTDKGILIAQKGGGMNVPDHMFTAMRFAQAEFYFHEKGEWDKVKEDAMWKMAWRARLRRIRPMAPDIGEFSFGYATGKLTGLIGDKLTGALMDGDVFKFIMGQAAFDWAAEWAKKGAQKLGAEVDKWLDSKLKLTSWEIIH